MNEEWRDIPEYEGFYQVSNLGNVRSLITDRLLKPNTNRLGYRYVILYKGGKSKTLTIHRLVMRTFKPIASKQEINHLDGDKTNNTLSNLAWCTRSENVRHAFEKLGRKALSGENSGASKLSNQTIANIRNNTDLSVKELAALYDVTPENIRHIIKRRTWKHVE